MKNILKFCLFVVFREKVTIPYDKPYIIIRGDGMSNTLVEWDDHSNTMQSPTFFTMADNTVVKYITFKVR